MKAALRRIQHDTGGNVAVIFALVLMPILLAVGAAIDYSRANATRTQLQAALDAATLFAARSNATSDDDLQSIGMRALQANLTGLKAGELISASFKLEGDSTVTATANVNVPAIFMGLAGQDTLLVGTTSEVVQSSTNVEVALVLDVTGSMAGQRVKDLRDAAKELIRIVVKDVQKPKYSKVALVPYSMGVNVGDYAPSARGAIKPEKPITGASRTDPVVVTAPGHGFANGDTVHITGVNGMHQINDRTFTISGVTANKFALSGVNGSGYSNYGSDGSVYCTKLGCEYQRFTNAGWPKQSQTFQVSTCVSERTGSEPYTDAAPGTSPVGLNYPSANNPCLSNTIVPLTSHKGLLTSEVAKLKASGSTGGHIGVAWGWYMLSPNFASLWGADSKPGAYNDEKILKVVVLMTDGEYNSSYCQGVISKDSLPGSGATSDHIDCNAPNGDSFEQAKTLCKNIKDKGITVYTVGLDIVDDKRAKALVQECATSPSYVYLPSSGVALKDAFRTIAQEIEKLRIAK